MPSEASNSEENEQESVVSSSETPNPGENERKSAALSFEAADFLSPISIDKLLKEIKGEENPFSDTQAISEEDKRKNYKVQVTGILALLLWVVLGTVVIANIASVIFLAERLSSGKELGDASNAKIERIEKAVVMINDTAKTMYSFLTTLATAVTGYYFTTKDDDNIKKDED